MDFTRSSKAFGTCGESAEGTCNVGNLYKSDGKKLDETLTVEETMELEIAHNRFNKSSSKNNHSVNQKAEPLSSRYW